MCRRVLLAGLAGLVLAGCGGGGGDPAKPTEDPGLSGEAQQAIDELDANARPRDDAGDVGRLLRERATALEAEDILALEATATGAQRAADHRERAADQAAADRADPVRGRRPADGRARRRRRASRCPIAVRGMPRPFITARKLTLRRRSVGWRVASDEPRARALPWEIAAFRATRTRHVVLLTPPGVDPGELRPGLERAYREDIRRATCRAATSRGASWSSPPPARA